MNKQLSLILSFCAIILFSSCDKTETPDDQWRLANEAQFNEIARDSEYTKIESQSKRGFIMYKVIKAGTGETPFFTDRVRVLYTGWYKRDWSKGNTYTDNRGQTITNKVIFDSTDNRNNTPREDFVNTFIDGFSTALQHMKVGDKWEVWIPSNLAYGATGYGQDIPGYTTLVFEIELVSIVKNK